ncbi:MAG: sn-glycerol-1-phosphate dehydrogenase, partial [Clostridiaceae bacterium]|nr:sn-glycerol-1-phosphate dehydrogenase [Clostridiaceae bacterium]
MKALKDLTIQELISTEITDCPCGKIHKMPIHGLELGSNALESIGRVFQELTITRAFIICDQNTKQASFPLLLKELKKHSIPYQVFEFPEFHLEPDEQAVGSLIMAFDKSCDGILAVGSGVINDLAKVLASISERPLVTLATAASMDGYASNNASMIQNNLKVSLYYECADVVIADTRILAASPPDLLRAGLGDMLAKYTSICEWRISHLVTGEYYCENVADLVRHSLKRILDLADDLLTGDLQAVEEVFLGLYKTGLAMGYAGISRP